MDWDVPGSKLENAFLDQLVPEDVLYEFDGPRIFTHKSTIGLLLAYLSDEGSNTQRFVLAPTSRKILDSLKKGIISVRVALSQSWVWVADVDFEGRTQTLWLSDIADLPADALPAENTMLLPNLQPAFSIRMIGNNFHEGTVPASVMRQAVDGPMTALRRIAGSLSGTSQGQGRPEESIRVLSDPPIKHFAFNSFEVAFGVPTTTKVINLGQLIEDGYFESEFEKITLELSAALKWATDLSSDVGDINLNLLKALEKLLPPQSGVLEEVEVKGRLIEKFNQGSPFRLNRDVSKKVRQALSSVRDRQEHIVKVTGTIGELDKDKLQFTLRNTDDDVYPERVCSFDDGLLDSIMEFFQDNDIRVTVSGRETGTSPRKAIEVSVIARDDDVASESPS